MNISKLINEDKLKPGVHVEDIDNSNINNERIGEDVISMRHFDIGRHQRGGGGRQKTELEKRREMLNKRRAPQIRRPRTTPWGDPLLDDINLSDSDDDSDDMLDYQKLRKFTYKNSKDRKHQGFIKRLKIFKKHGKIPDEVDITDDMSTRELRSLYRDVIRQDKNKNKWLLFIHCIWLGTYLTEKAISLTGNESKIKGWSQSVWQNRESLKSVFEEFIKDVQVVNEFGELETKPNPSLINKLEMSPWFTLILVLGKSLVVYWGMRNIQKLADYVTANDNLNRSNINDLM